jgi:sporulation protein YlmC with PRC-barrel domain
LHEIRNREEEDKVSKLSTAAALAAIVAVATPAAFAQTRATPETRTEATASATQTGIQPDQIRASKMLGSTVYDVQNRSIGSVKDLVLDKDGKVDEVVIDVGSFLGMGGKYVAVKISDLKADNNRLTLDRTKEQLQQMANFQLENRNTGAGSSTSPTTGGHLGR